MDSTRSRVVVPSPTLSESARSSTKISRPASRTVKMAPGQA